MINIQRNKNTSSSFAILIAFAAITMASLFVAPKVQLQLMPSYNLPKVNVNFTWREASAHTMEEQVTSVLEARLKLIQGVESVSSSSSKNKSNIALNINKDADIELLKYEVAQVIRNTYPLLPEGVSYPSVSAGGSNANARPVLSYAVLSPGKEQQLQEQLEELLAEPLKQVAGVGEVNIYGIMPKRWNIALNYNKLLKMGIGLSDIKQAIRTEQVQYPLGQVMVGNGSEKQIVIKGLYGEGAETLKQVPVHTNEVGHITYLGDVATIQREDIPMRNFYRLNGQETMFLTITPEEGSNQVKVAKRVREQIETIKEQLPKEIELILKNDNTEYIQKEIKTIIIRSAITLGLLLLFTGIISLNLRYMLVIALSLLCNLIINFFFYYLFGVQLHLYSFAGITVSLGLLIDNSIVMVDHLQHKGNKRVFLALFASTLTTIASLSIIFFLDEKTQLNLLDFAIVLIINLSVSLAVALFFIPALMEYIPVGRRNIQRASKRTAWLKKKKRVLRINHFYTRTTRPFLRFKWGWIVVLVLGFGLPLFLLPNKIEKETTFAQAYNATLGSEFYTRKLGPVLEKVLGGTLRIFVEKVDHGKFYSHKERSSLVMYASLEEGSRTEQMNEVFIEIENYLKQFKEIDQFESRINGTENANLYITFKPEYEFTGFPFFLQDLLIQKAIGFSSIDARIYGQGDAFNNSTRETTGSYKVEFTGYNYEQVYRYAEAFRKELLTNMRIKEANVMGRDSRYRDKSWEYVLEADRKKIACKEAGYSALSGFLSKLTADEQYIGQLENKGQYEYLMLSVSDAKSFDNWQLQNAVFNYNNTQLKTGVLADIFKQKTSSVITKRNQQYVVFVEWDFIGTRQLGQMVLDEMIEEHSEDLPMGYKLKSKQRSYRGKKEKQRQTALIFLIVLIIYMISAVLFESLWQPLAVISLIPVTFIGVFLTFWIFGLSFDQGGYSALILLCGLTVNSAIYIINEMNNLKKQWGQSGARLYFKAYRAKIVPITLTLLSTLVGMVPFLAAGQAESFWFPLAAATCGGLMFSIIGVLYVLPMFFVKQKPAINN